MRLPFTADQFFAVFADYNRLFWPLAGLWWLASLVVLVRVWRQPGGRSAELSWTLGALWLWNAVAYHALLFTRINPAAWLFAVLFAAQAVLLGRAAGRRSLSYFATNGWTRIFAVLLIAYSFAYPFLTMAFGHRYPATPTFGVPCPTAILTSGLLMVADHIPIRLALIPIVWSVIGGSAAILLDVPTDYMLLAAGGVLLLLSIQPRRRAQVFTGA